MDQEFGKKKEWISTSKFDSNVLHNIEELRWKLQYFKIKIQVIT